MSESVWCACGAQWHGAFAKSGVIASHKERWVNHLAGCGAITHAEYREKFVCHCAECRPTKPTKYVKAVKCPTCGRKIAPHLLAAVPSTEKEKS